MSTSFRQRPGRLIIQPNGAVNVESPGVLNDARFITSLEGVSYPKSATTLKFIRLPMLNDWRAYSSVTRTPSGALDSENIVHLQGAMFEASGTSALPFTLPPALRPGHTVYVRVTMVNGTAGRLNIFPDGAVGLQSFGAFTHAQAFTSLEGVTYSKY